MEILNLLGQVALQLLEFLAGQQVPQTRIHPETHRQQVADIIDNLTSRPIGCCIPVWILREEVFDIVVLAQHPALWVENRDALTRSKIVIG